MSTRSYLDFHMPIKLILAFILLATPLRATESEVLRDKDTFLSVLEGRALTIGLFKLTLNVQPNGSLTGTAMGWDVTGSWAWKDGLFCREMDWSGYKIDYDCQLVEKVGEKLRFIAKYGKGQSADFRLK